MVADYQVEFNGLLLGDGTSYELVDWSGFYRRSIDLLTPTLPRYHGGLVGASYSTPRTIEFEAEVVADLDLGLAAIQADLATKRDVFMAAVQPMIDTEGPLVFKLPGQATRRVNCRAQRADSSITVESELGVARLAAQFVAADPAIYADTSSTLVLSPFAASAGLTYPVTYPKAYGAAGSGAGSIAANAGDWETWPTVTIAGPTTGVLTNPQLDNVTTGLTLALTANGGVSIAAGQSLVVAMHPRDRSVAFTTGASRYGQATGSFWPLQPGNNEIRFRASGDTSGATATLSWRSAWI